MSETIKDKTIKELVKEHPTGVYLLTSHNTVSERIVKRLMKSNTNIPFSYTVQNVMKGPKGQDGMFFFPNKGAFGMFNTLLMLKTPLITLYIYTVLTTLP